ncbi:hypothetical protein [Flavobacterium sp.]|uniref:hypothetical protein n=1 Tax=Flavobacterium sp. TaxID=239 RepID=UPI000EDB3A1D|nr:hypothetical protein [Flavobacterium sp.]HCQ12420.1 hypothetical protein [Flavobacterium sp.]
MESKIITPHPEKLEFLGKDLTTKINESTEDLLKTTNQWTWWYSIRSQSALKVLHQSRSLLYGKLYFLKEEFEKNVLHYGKLTKKFMRLSSIEGNDSIIDIEEQKQQIEVRTELNRIYSAQQTDYIAGNESRKAMLVSDSQLHINEAEHIKSKDYLDAVKNATTETKTYPQIFEPNFEEYNSSQEISSQNDIELAVVPKTNITPNDPQKSKSQVIYTQAGSAPDYFVVEAQLDECLTSAGENFAVQFSNPTTENVKNVMLSTTSKEALKQTTYKQNILSHIDFQKIVWASLVYCIALAGEVLIFSAIFGLVFNFSTTKSIITGTAPALISFVLGFSLYGTILNYIKGNNQIAVKIIRSSRLMLLTVILGLLYAFCMGLLYKNSLDQDDLRSQVNTLTEEQYVFDEDVVNDDMTKEEREQAIRENGTKINEVNTKLIKMQDGPMATVIKLTVACSSLIFLLFSGIMFGILLLFLSAYKTNKALKAIENQLPRIEAEFYAQKNVISEVNSLSNRILNWMGQKRFIEKLMAGDSTKEILYPQSTKENTVTFQPMENYTPNTLKTNL